ncbi:MAG: hypothetical protein K1X57_20965, partial [Gemmataceae bacterium]|nr:hypothetical protein [Gemmataceae bacterium]
MLTPQPNSQVAQLADADPRNRRAAGLALAPKGHMTPCFGLLTFFLMVDVACLVVPFYSARFSDSPWGSAERMAFLARAMAASLAFGLVTAIAAERRNHSTWHFLLGHLGFPVALVLATLGFDQAKAGVTLPIWNPTGPAGANLLVVISAFAGALVSLGLTRFARSEMPPMGRGLKAVCRLMFQIGNLWFGIALMLVIGSTVAAGTFVENSYGTKAAQYLIYRSPWFGAVFFTGGMSMLCATFRKYPVRLEQAGWLTVHSGLAMNVIGAMMSF